MIRARSSLRSPGIHLALVVMALVVGNLLARPASSAIPASPSIGVPDSAAFAARLEERISDLMERHDYPGFAVAVTRRCDSVHAAGYGLADRATGRRTTPRTAYQIGSVTKMFTGLLLGTLVAEGVVRLGDPLARHVPDSVSAPTDSAGATITLQHLALHVAGLPRYPANLERVDGDPILGYPTRLLHAELGTGALEAAVGARWSYSNYGYGVLGDALERAAGTSLERLVRSRIAAPLGMDRTGFDRERVDEVLATPYRDDDPRTPTVPWEMEALRGAGGLYSTADDLSRFIAFHLGCGDAALPAALRAGRELAATPFRRLPTSPTWAYGLGRFVIDDPEHGRVLMHGGDLDGYAAYVAIALDRGVGVTFLTNSGIGAPLGDLGEWLLDEAVEEFGDPPGGAR